MASESKAVMLMKACRVTYPDLAGDYERMCGIYCPQIYIIDMIDLLKS
jgi:hypothetical protein